MDLKIRSMACVAALAAALAAPARAGTPAEDAAAATREWAKAVMDNDVDKQSKLLPRKLFASPEAMERDRKLRLHDKELAIINGEKFVAFDVDGKGQLGKVGNLLVMVFPYQSVKTVREGKIQRTSSLIAVAEEGSSSWSVIDGSGQSVRSIKIFVPGYSGVPAVPPVVTKLIKAE